MEKISDNGGENPLDFTENQLNNLNNAVKTTQWYFTDTRDGIQGPFYSPSIQNQLKVISLLEYYLKAIDGIIEGGYAGATKYEQDKFLFLKANNINYASFGSSKLPKKSVEEHFEAILNTKSKIVTLFVKCSTSQVRDVLKITEIENLKIIEESIGYLIENKKDTIIDMEHFFDGYFEDKDYSKQCIKTCLGSGASSIVLCDTLGKTSPIKIEKIIKELCNEELSPEIAKDIKGKIGLHLHEDNHNTTESIIRGLATGEVSHVQGNLGYAGERIGNSPLAILFVTLLKDYGIDVFKNNKNSDELWKNLMPTYVQVRKLLTGDFPDKKDWLFNPELFCHAAGMHVGALKKSSDSYSVFSSKLMDILAIENYPGLTSSAGKENIMFYLEKCFDLSDFTKEEVQIIVHKSLEFLKQQKGLDYTHDLASFLIKTYGISKKDTKNIGKEINDFLGLGRIKTYTEINDEGNLVTTEVNIELDGINYTIEQNKNGIFDSFIKLLKQKLEKKYSFISDLKLIAYSSSAQEKYSDANILKKLVFKDASNHVLFSVISEGQNDELASIDTIKQAFYYFILCKEGKIKHVPDKVLEYKYQDIEWNN